MLVLAVLLVVSLGAGLLAGFGLRHLFVKDPSVTATRAIGRELRRRRAL